MNAYKMQANVMEFILNLFYNRSQIASNDANSVYVKLRWIIRSSRFDLTSRGSQPFVN